MHRAAALYATSVSIGKLIRGPVYHPPLAAFELEQKRIGQFGGALLTIEQAEKRA